MKIWKIMSVLYAILNKYKKTRLRKNRYIQSFIFKTGVKIKNIWHFNKKLYNIDYTKECPSWLLIAGIGCG